MTDRERLFWAANSDGILAFARLGSDKLKMTIKCNHPAEFDARKNASVVFKRYNEHQELFNKLHAMRYRFMAQIGKEQAKPFDELRGIVNEITGAARVLMRLWPHDHFRTDEQSSQHRKQIEKYEAIFWSGLEEEDPIRPKLNVIISDIESTCQAVIAGKGTLHGVLNWRPWPS